MANINLYESTQQGVTRVFEYLPQVIGAVLLIIVGHIVAKILQRITRRLLVKLRFDRAVAVSPAGNMLNSIFEHPSRSVARLTFWIVYIGFVSLAVSALNVPALTAFVSAVYGYLPNVVAAMAIFLVASAASAGSARFIQRILGNSPTANVLKTVVPSITMSVAVFMILNQLGIARDIVNITYIAIMGSLALGLGLAFGLGGKELAGRLLDNVYNATRATVNTDEVKQLATSAKSVSKSATRNIAKR